MGRSLRLQRRVLVVTSDAAAADIARKAGVKAVALVPSYPSRVALKWGAAYAALTAGWPVLMAGAYTRPRFSSI